MQCQHYRRRRGPVADLFCENGARRVRGVFDIGPSPVAGMAEHQAKDRGVVEGEVHVGERHRDQMAIGVRRSADTRAQRAVPPPVVLARRLATVDRLSEGRLVVGLGQGWMPEEFEAAGVPISRRGNGFEDYLAALTSAWGPDPVSYEGRFYRIPRSYFAPKPVQAGGPPVLIAAVAPPTAARAGRLGFGLNLVLVSWDHFEELLDAWRKARAAAGHDNAAPVVVRTNTIVGSDTNEIGVVAGRGPKAGADLRRLADYAIDEVFFETGRGPMPIAEQLDLVDEWRSELGA